jgi:hypothetical protein
MDGAGAAERLGQRLPLAAGAQHINNAGEDLTISQRFAPTTRTPLVTPAWRTCRSFGHQGLGVLPEFIGNFPRLRFGHAASINNALNRATLFTDKLLVERPGMQSLLIKAQRKGDFPGETFFWVEPSQDLRCHPGIFVRANYHYPFPKETPHGGETELLLKFLKSEWETACRMARGVAEKILDKIKPDNG